MSKSLRRVEAHALELGLDINPVRLEEGTLTAQQAADACGCEVDRIIKSILFKVAGSDEHVLFLTAGGSYVDVYKAAQVSGKLLEKADAASIRSFTGFAIGGVSPLGHLNPIDTYMEPKILTFPSIWAAAGTPHHVFEIDPELLRTKLTPIVAEFTK